MQESTKNTGSPHYTLLYESSGISPVRMLNILALAFCVAGLGLALMLLKAPPQTLVSQSSRVGWAAAMVLLAVGCPLGAWLYSRRIAARILLSADGRVLRIYEVTLLGTTEREITLSDVQVTAFSPGDAKGEESISKSRIEVDVRGQRGFVVPLGRNVVQHKRLIETLRQH